MCVKISGQMDYTCEVKAWDVGGGTTNCNRVLWAHSRMCHPVWEILAPRAPWSVDVEIACCTARLVWTEWRYYYVWNLTPLIWNHPSRSLVDESAPRRKQRHAHGSAHASIV